MAVYFYYAYIRGAFVYLIILHQSSSSIINGFFSDERNLLSYCVY